MKVAILGIDGYLGWSLALHLIDRGHEVHGIDDLVRRRRVSELECNSLTKIEYWDNRVDILRDKQSSSIRLPQISLGEYPVEYIKDFLRNVQPDTIVHLAEQPSAPWSMMNVENASITQYENVIGTLHLLWAMHEVCPNAHLVKLGTMGEYGTPECDIPEGEIPEECMGGFIGKGIFGEPGCPMAGLPFPRQAGSWYHQTKVHDSHNIMFACRIWDLCSTDIMQGVVFGVRTDSIETILKADSLITRFDYDECFGTVINRFCAQAILGHPLTVYGKGNQTRGYLPLKDSIFCMTLAIENPPQAGEYRTFNQFEQTYSVKHLAALVQLAASNTFDLDVEIKHYENPRKEMETHYYNPTRQKLIDLGYEPTTNIQPEVEKLLVDLYPYRHRIKENLIIPQTRWDTEHRQSNEIV